MADSIAQILNELFAVVVESTFSGDVSWDRENQEWLAEYNYGKGWRRQDAAGEAFTRVPDPNALRRAVEVADAFVSSNYLCEWCGVNDLGKHAVVPDVFGDAAIRCLLRPDPITVDSFGGRGEKKHWAFALDSCRSIKRDEIREPGIYNGPLLGVNLCGQPLTTVEAIERRWCSICWSAASTQRANHRHALETAVGREVTADELRRFEAASNSRATEAQLLSYLLAAMEERGIDDVRKAYSLAWRPLSAVAYVEERTQYGGTI